LALIERNRILLAAKLFPWSLLWLNAPYFLARVVSGIWEAARGRGEASLYPGVRGKLTIAAAMIRGEFEALLLLPRMLRKRRQVERIRKLTPREVRELILGNRISLRELSRQTTAGPNSG